MSDYVINPNLVALHQWEEEGKSGGLLEGSSRSGKTISSVFNIIRLNAQVTDKTFLIVKETYRSHKTTLYRDFNEFMPKFGIASPFAERQDVPTFKLWGNTCHMLGADNADVMHGIGSDYIYYNEMLDIPQSVFDQLEMRCRGFWWGDYNPKALDSWVYNKVATRSDVGFLKTTFEDNPYLSPAERRKILSYEPTHPDDRDLPRDQRRPHPTNIKEGTADDYMWCVYGLGLRSAPEGLVFQYVTWVKEFPTNIEKVYYGLDFGFTEDPSAFVKVGVSGKDMYLQLLVYEPTVNIDALEPLLLAVTGKPVEVMCDSSAPGMIEDLRRRKWRAHAVSKFPGSINYGIGKLKGYKIHLVESPGWRKEQGSYKWREVNGIRLDEPVDKHNHGWDAARMAVLGYQL